MRPLCLILLLNLICFVSPAQTSSYNFRKVTIRDGLGDGVVGPIAQDKYGYMWFGTLSGLNRYDGYRVTNFVYNNRDSFSVPTDFVRTIWCDDGGDIWFGYTSGLYQFDYQTRHFNLMAPTRGTIVNEIKQLGPHVLCLLTTKGVYYYDKEKKTFGPCESKDDQPLLRVPMYEGCVYRSSVYIAGDTGVIIYNSLTRETSVVPLRKNQHTQVTRICIDSTGRIWAAGVDKGGLLFKGINDNSGFEEIDSYRFNNVGGYDRILDLFVDPRNRLWMGTIWSGVISVNTTDNSFNRITYDARMPNTIPENHITKIFQDKHGFMWLGTEGAGATYFQPDYNLFKVFYPDPLKMIRPHIWCRAIAEDQQNNVWMGTGTGVVRVSADKKTSTLFDRNEVTGKKMIHSNSIRSLLCDDANNMWIGTSEGVNLYESKTGKILFFDEKDSLPKYFYWALLQDSRKTIWLGSHRGLYYKPAGAYKFFSLYQHPVLKAYAGYGTRSLLEDSRGNLWIGLNGHGLLLYNTKEQTSQYWEELGPTDNPLGKIITSIIEDKKGVIWFSSYYGLASYDYRTGKFTPYSDLRTMESLQISGLQVDDEDRLWFATTRGLMMLDKDRKIFKRFNADDGLPDIQFNDEGAYRLKNGQFVYPSYDGFVSFDPLQYKEKNISSNIIISSFNIPDYPQPRTIQVAETNELHLSANEDFFSIELTAFNYSNPRETWYAYKLEGFDKDWVFTRNRLANYTNVPGGTYTFHYKASSDPNNWHTREKTITIRIDTVFYKTWWFRALLAAFLAGLIFVMYRYRIRQKERLMQLENKSQLLEKEKAQVMYENLKQQLNPHFLFNSLTSLSSLIRGNAAVAGDFLEGLSKTYRYILKSRDNETVPLQQEVKFAETYVKLQQTRFEKGLKVCFNMAEEHQQDKIAPVTLQNMIENAIKHNIIDEESPLVIEIYTEDGFVIVRNNLQKKKFVETSNKQGLVNLRSLYHYLSGRPVEIIEDEHYFTVKIPLL